MPDTAHILQIFQTASSRGNYVNPGRYNITIVQGTTFQLSPQWLVNNAAVNMTGYSADMQIRQFVDSASLLDEASTEIGRAHV